jgi:signal transduction histidine kinase
MRSLSLKLTFAFLAVSLLGIILAAAIVGLETRRRFEDFVDMQMWESLASELAGSYRASSSWAEAAAAFEASAPDRPRPFFVVDSQGIVVIDGAGQPLGVHAPSGEIERGIPIEVDGVEVGRLVFERGEPAPRPPHSAFLGPFERGLATGAASAAVAALLLGILLARSLTQPLRELTAATRAVAAGDLDRQVEVRSNDELGELARSFNQMGTDLAHARNLRRQMTADIAHELRTPLSLILGHSEALSEGVLPPTEDALRTIHDEARQLSRLVEDLRLLALSEAGELQITREPMALKGFLERVAAAHAPQAQKSGISLRVDTAPDLPDVDMDSDRMAQVLDNLIANALRYTPAGGQIQLSAARSAVGVQIVVQDEGTGVPPDELPWIFERFYRGDRSRQRHEGGAGLGLAIARSIVEQHGGSIRAENTPGEGLRVIIDLPV